MVFGDPDFSFFILMFSFLFGNSIVARIFYFGKKNIRFGVKYIYVLETRISGSGCIASLRGIVYSKGKCHCTKWGVI